jgi:hypothetical protein
MSVGSFIRGAFMLAALLATFAQIFVDPSLENVSSACIVLTSSLAILLYMHWSDALQTHPLSVFVIFGFCLTTQLGALLVQTVYWTPLRFSLYDSMYTFGTLAFYQAIALGVHAIYCYFSAPPGSKDSWARAILRRGGVYGSPSAAALWIMAALGVAAYFLASRVGVISKIGRGATFLLWAPFLIPFFSQREGTRFSVSPRLLGVLVLYAILIGLFAIATNGRAMIFKGVLTVFLLYLLQGLRSTARVEAAALLKFGIGVLIAAVALQPLGQLVGAMGAARGSRGKIPPLEMISKTYDFLLHPELIRAADGDADAPLYRRAYDETYIKSSLFGRFVETKFHDNALHFGRSIVTDDSRARLRDVTIDTSLADMPAPLLHVLNIDIDKNALRYSMGDYLFYLAHGGGLGGYKTGSMFGQGVALLGPTLPLVYASICVAIFHWLHLLSDSGKAGAMSLSALAMMNIWTLVQYGITAESLAAFVSSIVREFPEWIVIYVIALLVARYILGERYAQPKS